jgi:ankyrin repeat protein
VIVVLIKISRKILKGLLPMKFINAERETPYPTAQALLREIANALDTKSYLSPKHARKLDDSCKKIDIHVGEFDELKELTVTAPIREIFGDEIWARVSIFLRETFKEYFHWMEHHPLDGMSVDQANQIFLKTQFFNHLLTSNFLRKDNYQQSICVTDDIDLTLLENTPNNRLLALMETKEAKDRVYLWLKGTESPSLKYVERLEQHSTNSFLSKNEWVAIKWGIVCRKFLRHCQPNSDFKLLSQKEISPFFKSEHNTNAVKFIIAKRYIIGIFEELHQKGTSQKSIDDRSNFENLLNLLKNEIDRTDDSLGIDYVYHQFKAHHLVLAGQLQAANEEYKQAFKKSLYRAHSKAQIQITIKEALLVAAYQKQPDKVFINKLKSAAILFGLDSLPARTEVEDKNKIELLNGNEIDSYRYDFLKMFPAEYAYSGVQYPKYIAKVGFLIEIDDEKLSKDLNKKQIKIGCSDGLQRKTTPLIVAATMNKVEQVEQLLELGSSVNVLSEVGDSPLLMSLTQMDFTEPTSTMDSRLFELISSKPHSANILNTVTTRKMNFPLMAAVETGNPEVVKKVISMSNEIKVDLKGGLDSITPLYCSLGLIYRVKHPILIEQFINQVTPETIHRLKPIFSGTNDSILGKHMSSQYRQVLEAVFAVVQNKSPSNPSKLRQIARILIHNGANVNEEHLIKGMRYTPLMLAAEFNEVNLFRLMVEHGGDWKKVYVLPEGIDSKDKAINCLHIAKYYKATQVVEYINSTLL